MCDLLDIHGRTHSSPTPRSSDLWISTFDYLNREERKTSDLPNATDASKRSVALPGFDAANGPFFDRNASSGYPSFRIGATTATNQLTPMAGGVGIKTSAPNRRGEELGSKYNTNADGNSGPETDGDKG